MSKYQLYCDGNSTANLAEPIHSKSQIFPEIVLRRESFVSIPSDDQIGEGELPLSMVWSAGESKPYSLFFFEGSESRWFFKEKKHVFEVLFNKMTTGSEPNWSRFMKRVVLTNNNGPLFEMMDGRLYIFDIKTELLSPFFIKNTSQIRAIGSGIMSNVIMVQTTDGKIFKKHFNEEAVEVAINDPSPVKLFSCYCRDLQIIVLENNKLFIIKDGSTQDSHYGFSSLVLGQSVEVQTPFVSGIKKVSSGYGHCAVLLENGQVFSRGLNNYRQCATTDTTDIDGHFFEIPVGSPVFDIECGSICTALQTKTHFIFYGSLKSDFSPSGHRHLIEYSDQQMSIGPWHGLIFRNRFKKIGKSETYFINNLKSLAHNSSLSDSVFYF